METDVQDPEVKELVEGFKKEWEQVKAAIDEAKANRDTFADLEEKWEKANRRLDAFEASLKRAPNDRSAYRATSVGRDGREVSYELTPEEKQHSVAFKSFVKRGKEADDLHQLAVKAYESKDLRVESDPEGGYTVPPYMASTIVKRLFDTSPVRQVAGQISITGVTYKELADVGQFASGWVGETDSRPQTANSEFSMLEIPTHEQYANPAVTQTLLDESSINIEDWISMKIADILTRTENTAFVLGDGVAKPRGFMTYAAGTSWGQVEQVNSGAAAALTPDGLMDLVAALQIPYLPNARWALNRATLWSVRKFRADAVMAADGAGGYLWAPSIQAGIPSTLLGYPVQVMEDIASEGSNALCAAFGDFAQAYLVVDRVGIRTLRDPYTAKPYVLFYTTKAVGGGVRNFDALKIQKCST